jgi:hypothetical protein
MTIDMTIVALTCLQDGLRSIPAVLKLSRLVTAKENASIRAVFVLYKNAVQVALVKAEKIGIAAAKMPKREG